MSLPPGDIPHATILRPVKGLEPHLYECLASTFRQLYPRDKLTLYFCISSRNDPAFPILERLLADFPAFDAKIFVEEEDPNLSGCGRERNLGPNPKIRNMSRGYREAKGDILWIIDCNVWVGKGVAGRMVDKLCGFAPRGQGLKHKFVHQLPLVVDVDGKDSTSAILGKQTNTPIQIASTSTAPYAIQPVPHHKSPLSTTTKLNGSRLEELFLSSSHAKFYTAINTVLIAPCIVGKSNMFRRSHLDRLTASNPHCAPGIDFFSHNICEDHLIGDLLWKNKLPEELAGKKWSNHGLVFGDLAIQPMAGMSVSEYIARRVRWLRVRKFTVMLATFVEPGTESFLCSAYGAFAVSTLPWLTRRFDIPPTWTTFSLFWLLSVTCWAMVDWTVYLNLQSAASVEVDEHTPDFARTPRSGHARRPFREWVLAWVGREMLALPIWIWAVLGGSSVVWRGKKFVVGMDMRVRAFEEGRERRKGVNEHGNGSGKGGPVDVVRMWEKEKRRD